MKKNASAFLSIMAALVMSLSLSAPARAQIISDILGQGPNSASGPSDGSGGDGGHCPKECAKDYSPCDPINFKIADGRCSGIQDEL